MSTPSTEWKEVVPAGEAARFEGYAKQLREMQKRRAAASGGRVDRALHAKGQLGLQAELTVLGDLPAHARQGLFATPGTYPAYVRFSNGAGRRQADAKPDVRGVAIKVVGVPGKKVIPGMEDAKTQDFLLIRSPSTPFRDPDEFVPIVLATASPALLPFRVIGHFGLGRGLKLMRALLAELAEAMTSLATTAYFSATPIQWGAYAVHYALAPHAKVTPRTNGAKASEYLGEELAAALREGPVTYDFRVQFFVDETKTPIEDGSVEWKEADAPFVTVGRLTLAKQDVSSARGKAIAAKVDAFSFDPWHALVAHKPLGSMMRARNFAYRESTEERKAAKEPEAGEPAA